MEANGADYRSFGVSPRGLATSATTAIEAPCMVKTGIGVKITSVSVAAAVSAAESPGSWNPDAAVVVAGGPEVAVTGAGRNVSCIDWRGIAEAYAYDGSAKVTAYRPYKFASDWTVKATTSKFMAPKFLRRGIGGHRAGSEQSSN